VSLGILTENVYRTCIRFEQSSDHLEERAFSSAVWTDNSHPFASD